MEITGCILAKNEEKLIKECIKCLKELTDEIIVVNNGSIDKTKEISLAYGCNVIDSPDTYIDESRNLYFENARTPWILILDADERIDINERAKIYNAIENANEDVYGFYLPRYEYLGYGKWAEIRVIRLVRNLRDIRYNNFKIHSSISPSIVMANGKMPPLNVPIHHLDILIKNRALCKREKYINQIKWEITYNSKNPFIWTQYMNLGVEYMASGSYEEAEEMFMIGLQINEKSVHFATIYRATNFFYMKKFDECRNESRKLISIDSKYKERAYLLLAEIALLENDFKEAQKICEINVNDNPESASNLLNLASLIEESDPWKAIEIMNKAIEINPYLLKSLIYREGSYPNLFHNQNVILSSVKDIFYHMSKCWNTIGKKYRIENA